MGYRVIDASVTVTDDEVIAAELTVQGQGQDGKEKNITLVFVEVAGCPALIRTDGPVLSKVKDDPEKLSDLFNENESLIEEYEDIFSYKGTEAYDALLYLLYLMRCEREDEEKFIRDTVGKELGEIELPKSDIQEDYEAMCREETDG